MIGTGDLKKGLTIALNGTLYQIIDWQHIKSGRGSAQIKLKLRDLCGGHTIEHTCQSGEKFEHAVLERNTVQFLYSDADFYYVMDAKTFEQTPLTKKQIGDAVNYLKENMNMDVFTYNDKVVSVELPNSVELTVVETDPGFKGDTAAYATKPGKLETGFTIPIPLFVKQGDKIRVDTRTGQYVERAG
jgi:elongation factor P